MFDSCVFPASQIVTQQHNADSTDRAEVLAMEGDADGSIAMTEAADKFNEEHTKLLNELTMPERTKSVCEVCGVFINSTDNEQRRLVRIHRTALSKCHCVLHGCSVLPHGPCAPCQLPRPVHTVHYICASILSDVHTWAALSVLCVRAQIARLRCCPEQVIYL